MNMDIRDITKIASNKADEVEAYLINKEVITIRIASNKIVEAKGIKDKGLALRLIKDKRIMGVKTSLIDKEGIERCLKHVGSIGRVHDNWLGLPTPKVITPFDGYDKALDYLTVEDCINITTDMLEYAKIIDNVSGSLHLVKEEVEIANTNDLYLNEKATYILTTINTESNGVSGIGFSGSRHLNKFKPIDAVSKACEMTTKSINAKKCNEDRYSIILEPYALGELLSFVFEYNFNCKMYRDKKSCFVGRLGDKIAVEDLTVYDDGRIDDGLGSKAFDDEGVESRKNTIIEKGIFRNIIYDTFYAYKEGKISSGNGSRLGYPVGRSADPFPLPAMHNIVIEGGNYSKEEIIKDTKRGILIGRLWYAYPVNPEVGDFSCTARSGIFLIEDGEIKYPCKMVRIIDNLKRALLNISAISKEREQVLVWHGIPCITPTIRIDGVSVKPI